MMIERRALMVMDSPATASWLSRLAVGRHALDDSGDVCASGGMAGRSPHAVPIAKPKPSSNAEASVSWFSLSTQPKFVHAEAVSSSSMSAHFRQQPPPEAARAPRRERRSPTTTGRREQRAAKSAHDDAPKPQKIERAAWSGRRTTSATSSQGSWAEAHRTQAHRTACPERLQSGIRSESSGARKPRFKAQARMRSKRSNCSWSLGGAG